MLRGASHQPLAAVGGRSTHPRRRFRDGQVWWSRSFEWLEWSHVAALRLLQGELVTQILSPHFYLLGGHHRPTWHTRPGVDDPILAFVPSPPGDVPAAQLMVELAVHIQNGA